MSCYITVGVNDTKSKYGLCCIHYQSFKEFGARVGQRNEIRKPIPKDPRAINSVYLQNY